MNTRCTSTWKTLSIRAPKQRILETNGISERVHRRIQNQFYAGAIRRKLYTSLEALHHDVDEWTQEYTEERPNFCKHCFGQNARAFTFGQQTFGYPEVPETEVLAKIKAPPQVAGWSGQVLASAHYADTSAVSFRSRPVQSRKVELAHFIQTARRPRLLVHPYTAQRRSPKNSLSDCSSRSRIVSSPRRSPHRET
jgi:hypothetical protein